MDSISCDLHNSELDQDLYELCEVIEHNYYQTLFDSEIEPELCGAIEDSSCQT